MRNRKNKVNKAKERGCKEVKDLGAGRSRGKGRRRIERRGRENKGKCGRLSNR